MFKFGLSRIKALIAIITDRNYNRSKYPCKRSQEWGVPLFHVPDSPSHLIAQYLLHIVSTVPNLAL